MFAVTPVCPGQFMYQALGRFDSAALLLLHLELLVILAGPVGVVVPVHWVGAMVLQDARVVY